MSSDQRPGKVRVFSSGRMTELPRSQPGGFADPDPKPKLVVSEPAAPTPASLVAEQSPVRFLLLAGLYLLGCAAGGAMLVWSGLMSGGSL